MSGQPAPHHDDPLEPVAHQIVTTWPPGTFVENLAPLPDGDFVVSLHSWRELARVRRGGSRSTLANLPVSPVGIVGRAHASCCATTCSARSPPTR